MSYCTKCGNELKEGAKFCVYCGEKLAPAPQPAVETPAPVEEVADEKLDIQEGDLQSVNRRVYWDIQAGQIARVVKSSDFAKFKNIKGIVISEGTTAYVRVNGKTVMSLEGGIYDFKQSKPNPKESGLAHAWSVIKNLFSSKKPLTAEEEKAIVENIRKENDFTIIVLVNKAFQLLVGAKQGSLDDYKNFVPMQIQTRHYTLQVGVNAYFQIQDKEQFILHWLTDKAELTTAHLVDELSDIIRTRLAACLDDTAWEGNKIPDDLRRALKDQLNENAVNEYFGLSIARVVEITAVSEDLERFRQLSTEMYLSEQELDYLKRTNDFKNRLAEVQNAQQIHEARTGVELQRELDNINKDNLLREDELEKFKLILESERRLREARSKEEEDKVMAEIRQAGLLREIDYKRLEQEADIERRRREADFEFEQQQRQEALKAEHRQRQFEQFMAMESAANQHEEEMARIQAAGNQQWSERLHQQQQAQNDQMMQLLQTMAGARAPQPTYQAQPSAAPTKFCPECGKRISVDSKHCPECGAKQL